MGMMDRFRRQKRDSRIDTVTMPQNTEPFAVAADNSNDVSITFNNTSITYTGDIEDYDYNSILRDKQTNINDLYKLADYFVDSDPLFGGAIKEVYVPFSLTDDYQLIGGDDKVKQKYEEYYERIHLREKLENWFYEFYLYENVYFSIMPDGDIITLPPHLVRISNISVNNNPVVEFNCKTVRDDIKRQGIKAYKAFMEDEDLDIRLAGFPPEVTEALKDKRTDWVQLNPATTFVLQGFKEGWKRYAVPMVARCLRSFAKKALIGNWEDALLNLAARSFVHVTVGSPTDSRVVVDNGMLTAINNIFKKAMTGSALATTNNWCDAKVIQPKTDDIFEGNKYAYVNEQILSAVGVSGSSVSGSDSSTSFGSTQISTRMISQRINEARRLMCDLMNRINRAVNGSKFGLPRSNDEKLPKFVIPTTDLTNVGAFQQKCLELWKEGVISNETMLNNYGIDYQRERKRRDGENKSGDQEVFAKPGTNVATQNEENQSDENETIGRPTLTDDERNSDPTKSDTGRNPKPSNEEGSEKQEEQ